MPYSFGNKGKVLSQNTLKKSIKSNELIDVSANTIHCLKY